MTASTTIPRRLYEPVPFTQITVDDRFWSPRLRVNREHTLPHIYQQCRDTGRIDAFRLNWKPGLEPVPHIFWDSDVGKWLEAASYSLATHPDPALDARVDEVIALLASAQHPDGYLNAHFTVVKPELRWRNLRDWHELYCAGHLIEAGVAHSEATGKRTLLEVVRGYADYIASVFGPEPGQKRGYCGHEEIELALVKLYRATGEPRYLRLSEYFINERGQPPNYFEREAQARGDTRWRFPLEYYQAHRPVREQADVFGHAVRVTYLCSAMADLAGELGDAGLWAACQRLWADLTGRHMYLTGGIGSTGFNEGFTHDYDLPNETAYAETCAAIGLVMWAHRMLQVECDARYADVMERALYNGVLSGVSLDGRSFFYENPLAAENYQRQPWFDCACCPPNLARLLASFGQNIYGQSGSDVAVHLYVQSTVRLTVGGQPVTLRQITNYPWDGQIRIAVEPGQPVEFGLRLRVPGWSRGAKVSVNGEAIDVGSHFHDGYVRLGRRWEPGDEAAIELPMPVERMYAHPSVRADLGRVALQRGPLVYCFEAQDQPAPLQLLALPRAASLEVLFDPGQLGGIVKITGQGLTEAGWGDALYRPQPARAELCALTAVPYCLWGNREPGPMGVWLREGALSS